MGLHEVALDIGIAVNHSTYDTLYLAFAVAMGASALVVADGPFIQSVKTHSDPNLSAMMLSLNAWARSRGVGQP
jgi:predicted nucleic acid-binding protein